MAKGLKKVVVFLALLLLLPSASASITLNDFKPVYNLGDELNFEISILESKNINCFVKLTLNCDDSSTLIYQQSVNLRANNIEKITPEFHLILTKPYIDAYDLLGLCYIEATLEDMEAKRVSNALSDTFTISDMIKISAIFNKEEFLPGEKIVIEGIATKENGENVDGVSIIAFGKDYVRDIYNSKFSFNLVLNNDIRSGSHQISISVSDENGNKGEYSKEIAIIPVLTNMRLELNEESFLPGDELLIKSTFYDQAGDNMEGDAVLFIISADNMDIIEEKVFSGEEIGYIFERDAFPGDWEIITASGNVESRKFVKVLENEKIDVEFTGDSLSITNVGNVIYRKAINIGFEGYEDIVKKTKNLALDVGETITYKLSAPEGDYNLTISNDDVEKIFGGVSLTGKSISVTDTSGSERKALIKTMMMALLVGAFVFIFGMKYYREWRYRNKRAKMRKDDEAVYGYIRRMKAERPAAEDFIGVKDEQ